MSRPALCWSAKAASPFECRTGVPACGGQRTEEQELADVYHDQGDVVLLSHRKISEQKLLPKADAGASQASKTESPRLVRVAGNRTSPLFWLVYAGRASSV
jgi:hypothetical protein